MLWKMTEIDPVVKPNISCLLSQTLGSDTNSSQKVLS